MWCYVVFIFLGNDRQPIPSLLVNYAFTPPNQFRCSVPRASPQPSVAAPFAVRISSFPQQISLPPPTPSSSSAAPYRPQSVRQFYLFLKLDCVRVLADGAQGDSMTIEATYDVSTSYATNGLKLTNANNSLTREANSNHLTFLGETPCTFVVPAGTRKVKSGREKALSGRKEGGRRDNRKK